MKKNSNSVIINEIMSSKNSSTIILSHSNGQYTGFIADLVRNYPTAYWIDESYEHNYSIAYSIMKAVLSGTPLLEQAYRYSHCKSEYSVGLIMLSTTLRYISEQKEKCLLVISGVEHISDEKNLRTIEVLLKRCPPNLKIVIVSSTFPEINYNIFKDTAPGMVMKNKTEVLPLEEEILEEDLTEEDFRFLYNASIHKFASVNFTRYFYPRGEELLRTLAVKYRSLFLQTQEGVFNVNEDLSTLLEKNGKVRENRSIEYTDMLFDYLCRGKGDNLIKALTLGVERKYSVYVDKAAKALLESEKFVFHLYEYAKYLRNSGLEWIKQEHIYARFFKLLVEVYGNGSYELAAEECKTLLTCTDDERFEAFIFSVYVSALRLMGKTDECAQIATDYIIKKMDEKGESCLATLTPVIGSMTLGEQQINSSAIIQRCRNVEKYLTDKRFEDKYWYADMLQKFVGMNLDFGNYKKAIEHLNAIKRMIPFYIVPHDRLSSYVFAGTFDSAAEMAEQIIDTCRWSGNETGLVNVYAFLGIWSLYNKRNDDAVEYYNKAVAIHGNTTKLVDEIQFITCVRAMVCAETGMTEYAKDIITIYVKRSEVTGSKYKSMTCGAAAYCYLKAGDKEGALYYAKKCLQEFSSRSAIWLMATAILINDMLEKEELQSVSSYVTKFLQASVNYGMEMVSVFCKELTDPIIRFAQKNGIEEDAVKSILQMRGVREKTFVPDTKLRVKLMGDATVYIESNEVLWKTKKAKELFLLYLLRREEGMDRAELIKQFWPEYTYVSAINNLKTTNNIIRNTLSAQGIKFDLEYVNSKYVMHIEAYDMDYESLRGLLDKFFAEPDVHKRGAHLLGAIALYKEGFATDVRTQYFISIHDKLKEDLVYAIVQQIKDYEKTGDTFEVKRLLAHLKKMNVAVDGLTSISELIKRTTNK